MSSGSWGPGSPAGESGEGGRGRGRGERATSSAPVGTARPVIAVVCAFLALVSVAVAVLNGRADGVLVLATVFALVAFWAAGVFTRNFWRR